MGFFSKIGGALKGVFKNIPIVGNVVSAADAVFSAIKGGKKKPTKTAAQNDKIVEQGRWFAWAPNWAIIASGVGILAVIAWAIFGKKKRKRR